jgi:hypothetical protein
MKRRTKLHHPLSWYEQEYALPEQTVVNAYKRGWPLDDPAELLVRFLNAPGPKSKGIQGLINFVNGQSGPSTVHRGSSRNAPKPKTESSIKEPVDQQGDDPTKFVRLELAFGNTTMWRMITPAEADKVIQLSTESWQTNTTDNP